MVTEICPIEKKLDIMCFWVEGTESILQAYKSSENITKQKKPP